MNNKHSADESLFWERARETTLSHGRETGIGEIVMVPSPQSRETPSEEGREECR